MTSGPLRFLPMAAVMAAIFLLSHTPGQDLPQGFNGLDKICHAVAYAALAASCLYGLTAGLTQKTFAKYGLIVIFCSVAYGLSDEFHQSFIPGRSPSWLDIAADASGAVLAVLSWGWWRHGGRNRRRGGGKPPSSS
ncbi:MAG: VanZ family protein [Deltaproteobacteria bacterium]|nr:VanZ family protein [Deltaproteobacteria bacterium]